jgi:hypothetical protein
VHLRQHRLEMVNISNKMLDRAEKYFSAGHHFDIQMTTRTSQLQQTGFERQLGQPLLGRHPLAFKI